MDKDMMVEEDEITAGGNAVHRQAMVLRQNDRYTHTGREEEAEKRVAKMSRYTRPRRRRRLNQTLRNSSPLRCRDEELYRLHAGQGCAQIVLPGHFSPFLILFPFM